MKYVLCILTIEEQKLKLQAFNCVHLRSVLGVVKKSKEGAEGESRILFFIEFY
jgi:hypothetical protein